LFLLSSERPISHPYRRTGKIVFFLF
jgi:hypothetical protein